MVTRRQFDAVPASVDDMLGFVDAMTQGLDAATAFDLRLACEEMLVNVVSYAYPDGGGRLTVTWTHDAAEATVVVRIEDSGVAFNPLDRPEPDLLAPIAEREIGGLGIMMARQRVDEVRYERTGATNVLTLVKRVLP